MPLTQPTSSRRRLRIDGGFFNGLLALATARCQRAAFSTSCALRSSSLQPASQSAVALTKSCCPRPKPNHDDGESALHVAAPSRVAGKSGPAQRHPPFHAPSRPYSSHDSATQLLSLNHLQRMLRRLPVGESASLFYYNELPSNVQRRVPPTALQHLRRSEEGVVAQGKADGGGDTGDRSGDTADTMKASAEGSHPKPKGPSPPTSHLKNARGPSASLDVRRFLVLREPQLTPSAASLFALFRRVVRERQTIRRQQQQACLKDDGGLDVCGGDLRYLEALEEPCLLLPDTCSSVVALGLTADRSTALNAAALSKPGRPDSALSAEAKARLDGFHLGLVTECTGYRVDYSPHPQFYILGVPTELLNARAGVDSMGDVGATTMDDVGGEAGASTKEQRSWMCPPRTPVDISRWVVYDDVSSQFLLRRGGRGPVGSAVDQSRMSEEQKADASPYLSFLEDQVFLAHGYSFDPKAAYEAAVAVQGGRPQAGNTGPDQTRATASDPSHGKSPGRSCYGGYTLFFFQLARIKERSFFGSVKNAGVLYPSCFRSYLSEVKTTQMLAAEQTGSQQGTGHNDAGDREAEADVLSSHPRKSSRLAERPPYHVATPFFITVSGKRYHLAAAATGGGDGLPQTTSWTAQVNNHPQATLGCTPLSSRREPKFQSSDGPTARSSMAAASSSPTEATPAAASAHAHVAALNGACDGATDLGSAMHATPQQLRTQMCNAFREWKAMLAARAMSSVASPRLGEAAQASHKVDSEANDDRRLSVPVEHAADAVPTTRSLEDRLHAERHALTENPKGSEGLASFWSRGWRLAPAPIAVAMPIVYSPEMSLRFAATPVERAVQQVSEVIAGSESDSACVTVTDAPLANSVWRALYLPETLAGSFSASPLSASTPHRETTVRAMAVGGGAVLPLAEDRLATARYRVLLRFLRTPRRVRPAAALSHPAAGTVVRSRITDTLSDLPSSLPASELPPTPVATSCLLPKGCCPALWHVDELEALCGWRRFRSQLLEPFGSFSALLNHDLYVSLGRQAPAFPSSYAAHGEKQISTTRGCVEREQHAPRDGVVWRSPIVLLNDVAYIRRVLQPAMLTFASHTCLLLKSGLYVYRGLHAEREGSRRAMEQNQDAAAPASSHDGASEKPLPDLPQRGVMAFTDEAVDAGVHHRLLVGFLKKLQQSSPDELCAWLAEPLGDPLSNVVMSQRTGVPEMSLAFFKEKAAAVVAEGKGRHNALSAEHASSQVVAERADALLSLTSADVRVVPLLDFLTWASLCSEFSAAARDVLRCHAAAVRSKFTVQDCVMAAKYCAQYPSHFCVEGGSGSTVALMQ
ncbi:hypothetical protein ABL78_5633 [Leptomonas seymouri]|uniref:Uncharacterized protein n=1 Tax=Leptomonas seymouri TaxID=5684 RepID=A0A0N1I1Z5_LEPSE|nr:hypothetical protein ABL78_5633 [Leptomonas seymouri]|eukprot:KPI85321.1 hypothetical protein ABL78_5633 [Leptomonas seymouri]